MEKLKYLLLNGEEVKEVDKTGYWISNYGNFFCTRICNRQKEVRKLKCKISRTGYKIASYWIGDKKYHKAIHRLVAEYFLPTWNTNLTVDHIDEDKLNNNVNNLRMVTSRINSLSYYNNHKEELTEHLKLMTKLATEVNTRKDKPKGVRKRGKYILSELHFNGKYYFLGSSFKTEEEASKAYQDKLIELSKNN